MRLDAIDWNTLTRPAARGLMGAAKRREQALAARFNQSGATDDEDAWREAAELEEDLRVYFICGLKPGEH